MHDTHTHNLLLRDVVVPRESLNYVVLSRPTKRYTATPYGRHKYIAREVYRRRKMVQKPECLYYFATRHTLDTSLEMIMRDLPPMIRTFFFFNVWSSRLWWMCVWSAWDDKEVIMNYVLDIFLYSEQIQFFFYFAKENGIDNWRVFLIKKQHWNIRVRWRVWEFLYLREK